MNCEEWRPVVGDPRYEVSSLGRVRRIETGRIRKWSIVGAGYPTISLSIGRDPETGKQITKTFYVHALVAEAFIGPRPAGMEICHYDGDRMNAAAENLRYDNHRSNMLDAVRHGSLRSPDKRTHCKNGHPFTDEDTYKTKTGSRVCRTCRRSWARKRYHQLKEVA